MIAIGYDIGSSFVKAALVDAETGKPIERVRVPDAEIPMIANEIGWAEQDPKLWWEYLCDATKSLIEKSNIKADDNDFHGMIKAEHDLWRRISTSAKSDHEYSGKTTYPGFSTVACPENAGSLGVLGFAYKEYEDEDDADELDI